MIERTKRQLRNLASIIALTGLIGAAFTMDLSAQRLNDDLKNRSSKKKSAPVKKSPKKTTKKKQSPPAPTRSRNQSSRSNSKQSSKKTTKKVEITTAKTFIPPTSADTSQTFERFIDYSDSPNVTEEDWHNVVLQTTVALKSDPYNSGLNAQRFFAKGQLAYLKKDYVVALKQFKECASVLPESALPYYGIGNVYLATKQPNEAEDAFEKSIKLDEDFALAYNGRGQALKAKGKSRKANESLNQAGQLDLRKRNNNSAPVPEASSQLIKNGFSPTNLSFDEPVEKTKSESSSYIDEIRGAQKLSLQRQWLQANDKLDKLAERHPTSEVYLMIGTNYSSMEKWMSALEAYQKASELNPESALAIYNCGQALFELNEYQRASEYFEKALLIDIDGNSIDRGKVRKMAKKAKEKAKDLKEGK